MVFCVADDPGQHSSQNEQDNRNTAESARALMLNVRMARAFGHGIGFAAGLIFLNVVFVIIIGFGSAKYKGPNGVPGDGPDRPLG